MYHQPCFIQSTCSFYGLFNEDVELAECINDMRMRLGVSMNFKSGVSRIGTSGVDDQ